MQKVKDVLDKIFENHPRDFNVKLWNGHLVQWSDRPKFTLVFREKKGFREILLQGDAYAAGKAFIENKLDIEGDIFEAIKLGDYLSQLKLNRREKLKILGKLLAL